MFCYCSNKHRFLGTNCTKICFAHQNRFLESSDHRKHFTIWQNEPQKQLIIGQTTAPQSMFLIRMRQLFLKKTCFERFQINAFSGRNYMGLGSFSPSSLPIKILSEISSKKFFSFPEFMIYFLSLFMNL